MESLEGFFKADHLWELVKKIFYYGGISLVVGIVIFIIELLIEGKPVREPDPDPLEGDDE